MNNWLSALVLLLGTCWGSFLNVLAVRGLANRSLLDRSHCESCNHTLRWWELIPLISWFIIQGHCTECRKPVSAWYPIIEGISALWIWSLVYFLPFYSFLPIFILSSALIITIRTDGEQFLILRWCTIGIIPFGIIAAYLKLLPITMTESIIGCILGASYLTLVRVLFLWWKRYEGLGEGDIELLAAIGSFLGPLTMLTTLILASCLGVAYGLFRLILSSKTNFQTPIPFGLFLAFGSWITLLIN
jgi:prepilin signal peptidase PulO-like enzyme (type II secretory pathway)